MKRVLPALLAIVLIVAGYGYLFVETTAVGAVSGTVLFKRNGKPFPNGIVALQRQDASGERWRTTTDDRGHFDFRHIPVGRYKVVPETEHHFAVTDAVLVREAQTSTITVPLATREATLTLAYTQQRMYATRELPRLPVSGIGDAGRPLTVALYRTRLSEVMVDAKAAESLREVGSRWGDNNPALLPKPLQRFITTPLATRTTPIPHTDVEGYFTQRVPLPDVQHHPGLYFVQIAQGETRAWTWLLVTDTALVTFRSPKDRSLSAFAVDMEKGTPRKGARVQVFVEGRVAAQTQTNADGLAQLTLSAAPDASHRETAVVTWGEDEAIVNGSIFYESGNPLLRGHIITDRPLYRPGQTIHYKGILRRANPGMDYAYTIPAGATAQVTVTDPQEVVLLRETKTVSAAGAVLGEFSLNAESATGNYQIEINVGGERISQSVELASYRKPEFEVSVIPQRKRLFVGEQIQAVVTATYYFGAPVPNAKVRWTVERHRDWSAESGGDLSWREDQEDADESGSGTYVDAGTVTLDATGHATIQLPARARPDDSDEADTHDEGPRKTQVPQVEDYTITATVEDSAERTVEASGTVQVTTADLRVSVSPEGYLASKGSPTRLFVTAHDHDGKPLGRVPIQLTVTRVQRDPKTKALVPTAVMAPLSTTTEADGRAVVPFTPPVGGDLTVRATAHDAVGRAATTEMNLWVTTGDAQDSSTYSGGLTLATDKRRYEPGETARVVLGCADTGQTALVTIEGDRLYRTIPVLIRQRVTTLTLPVKPEYGPNVSVHACYVYRKQFASSETPLRVTLPQKYLQVTVTPQRPQYEPGQTAVFDITVKDSAGKPIAGDFSLSVADESIYALKEDDPKALRQTFYPHRSSQIQTEHSFSVVYLAGDEKDGGPPIATRKKFVDTAYWNGALTTDASGHATVSLPLPDNLTTWRASVYAITADTAVGYGRGRVVVNRPFFVRLDAPRFVVEGDTVRVQGLIHNNTGSAATVTVKFEAPGVTDPTKTLSVAGGTIGEATWTWTIPPLAGSARLKLLGWTGDRRYTDGLEQSLTVRPFTRESVRNYSAGADGLLHVALSPDTVRERSFLTVRVSPSLRAVVTEATDYLKQYPYGCVEQTVSRFVPLIAAGQADRPLVEAGVTRLGSLAHGDKGWGWWYKDDPDVFLTSYALWGLAEARDAGYPVPSVLFERGAKALWPLLESKSAPRPETAFALYTLTRVDGSRVRKQGVAGLTAVLHRFGEPKAKRADTLAWLVLFTRLVGLDSAPYVQALEQKAVVDGAFAHWSVPGDRWNATDRMTTALAVRALQAARPSSPHLGPAVRYLISTATDGYFGDTRDTAFVITTFCGLPQFQQEAPAAAPTLLLGDRPVPLHSQKRGYVATLPATALASGDTVLRVTGAGYATATLRESQRAPRGALPALEAKTVTLRREFVKLASGPKGLIPEAAATRFAQGDTVRVRLILETKEPLEYVLLEDRFPAGFEPNARGTVDEDENGSTWSFWYSHIDVRDDRLALFVRSLPAGRYAYEYHLRAQTVGETHALPAAVTPMYGTTLRAESTGELLEIHG